MRTKQVLIIRKDLKLRRGKEGAQLSHASNKILTDVLLGYPFVWYKLPFKVMGFFYKFFTHKPFRLWLTGSFTKACVYVESESDLLKYYEMAKKDNILASLIQDSGRTELHGIPTYTAVAIGPDTVEKIDAITGKLVLY